MKNIKARVWNSLNKSFTYPESPVNIMCVYVNPSILIGLDGSIFEFVGGQYIKYIQPDNESDKYVIDMYSGVPDKFGNRIYENDIIKYTFPDHTSIVGYVEYSSGSFRCNWPDQTDDDIGYMLTKSMEVIGHNHK